MDISGVFLKPAMVPAQKTRVFHVRFGYVFFGVSTPFGAYIEGNQEQNRIHVWRAAWHILASPNFHPRVIV